MYANCLNSKEVGYVQLIFSTNVESVIQYPEEAITFFATNGQNYGKMNTWIIVKIFQYIPSPKRTGHYA